MCMARPSIVMRKQAYIAKERVIPSAKADKYEADGMVTKWGSCL